jgi:hypothetical protein
MAEPEVSVAVVDQIVTVEAVVEDVIVCAFVVPRKTALVCEVVPLVLAIDMLATETCPFVIATAPVELIKISALLQRLELPLPILIALFDPEVK